MAIVRSFGALTASTRRPVASTRTTVNLPPLTTGYGFNYSGAYASIYATQPNVRICVDFLARNIAQLGYHVFRRVSDTDRERLIDHELAQWIAKPNPVTTSYRLFESTIADLAIYFNAYWIKVRLDDPRRRLGLVRLPPETVGVQGDLLPTAYLWVDQGRIIPLDLSEVVYFNGYNPLNALMGLSPLETLRRILAEETAAADYREAYWRNASRMEGVIERPKDAPKWNPQQKQSWREQWQARHGGTAGAGLIAVLEDGMTFRPTSYSAIDSEYTAARQLTREECTRAFHIPLTMVGILEHATFSNIKDQHKQLYTDCLGPWLEMVSQAIELWLLPEARDTDRVYGEFNIAEKLKGSFEEQATALRLLIGRPVMTANEGRARLNLPSIKDDPSADQLAAQQGGPAAVESMPPSDPTATNGLAAAAPIIQAHQRRQRARLDKVPAAERVDAFLGGVDRWTQELATDLREVLDATEADQLAALINRETLEQLEREA